MNRIDKLVAEMRALERTMPLLCRTPDGREMQMDIIEALRTGAKFIRTLDANHDFDELYQAVLSGVIDSSDLSEVE